MRVALLTTMLVASMVAVATCQTNDTRSTMRGLYAALSEVYIISLHPDEFRDPARKEDILLSLRKLSANAVRFEEHSQLDPGFDYARRSLARDCRDAAERFDRDEYAGTRFILNKLVENCVTCHSKLPAEHRFDAGRGFIDDANIEGIPDMELLKLEIATRQFDSAIATCERVIRSPEAVADHLIMAGVFEDYFKLTLRVKRDPQRAKRTLASLTERRDTPSYLGSMIATWQKALSEAAQDTGGSDLRRARKLIARARAAQRFPADRRGLVYFIDASSVLYEYLASRPPDKVDLSEAYYLLGLAESHISHGYWVSETDFYLERAIRLAPKTQSARDAYDLLEAYTISAFSGSAGMTVPEDIRQTLTELRRLID